MSYPISLANCFSLALGKKPLRCSIIRDNDSSGVRSHSHASLPYNPLDAVFRRFRIFGTTIVAKVRPPFHRNKACLTIKELTVCEMPFRHDRTFPLPQRPLPSLVRHHIAAFWCHQFVSRETSNATVQQRHHPYLLYRVHQVGTIAYRFSRHCSGTTAK